MSMHEDRFAGWEEHHADQVRDWMEATYNNDTEYDFTDNLRIARMWVKGEEKDYEARRAEGCCGFYDSGLTTCEGWTIRVGFNYGH